MRRIHTIAGPVAALLLALGMLTGCGEDEAERAATPQPVALGVVLDGGEPVEGVEVELLVWPSAQAASSSPEGAPPLERVGTGTTDAKGEFRLEALVRDLSQHATSDGLVGLQVRGTGEQEFSLNTTVRLVRAPDTGVTRVEPAEGMQIDLDPVED